MKISKFISSSAKIYLNNVETVNLFIKGRINKTMWKIVNLDKIAAIVIVSLRKMKFMIMNKISVKKD